MEKLKDSNEVYKQDTYIMKKDRNGKQLFVGDTVRFTACRDDKGCVWLWRDGLAEWHALLCCKDGEFIMKEKYIGMSDIKDPDEGIEFIK